MGRRLLKALFFGAVVAVSPAAAAACSRPEDMRDEIHFSLAEGIAGPPAAFQSSDKAVLLLIPKDSSENVERKQPRSRGSQRLTGGRGLSRALSDATAAGAHAVGDTKVVPASGVNGAPTARKTGSGSERARSSRVGGPGSVCDFQGHKKWEVLRAAMRAPGVFTGEAEPLELPLGDDDTFGFRGGSYVPNYLGASLAGASSILALSAWHMHEDRAYLLLYGENAAAARPYDESRVLRFTDMGEFTGAAVLARDRLLRIITVLPECTVQFWRVTSLESVGKAGEYAVPADAAGAPRTCCGIAVASVGGRDVISLTTVPGSGGGSASPTAGAAAAEAIYLVGKLDFRNVTQPFALDEGVHATSLPARLDVGHDATHFVLAEDGGTDGLAAGGDGTATAIGWVGNAAYRPDPWSANLEWAHILTAPRRLALGPEGLRVDLCPEYVAGLRRAQVGFAERDVQLSEMGGTCTVQMKLRTAEAGAEAGGGAGGEAGGSEAGGGAGAEAGGGAGGEAGGSEVGGGAGGEAGGEVSGASGSGADAGAAAGAADAGSAAGSAAASGGGSAAPISSNAVPRAVGVGSNASSGGRRNWGRSDNLSTSRAAASGGEGSPASALGQAALRSTRRFAGKIAGLLGSYWGKEVAAPPAAPAAEPPTENVGTMFSASGVPSVSRRGILGATGGGISLPALKAAPFDQLRLSSKACNYAYGLTLSFAHEAGFAGAGFEVDFATAGPEAAERQNVLFSYRVGPGGATGWGGARTGGSGPGADSGMRALKDAVSGSILMQPSLAEAAGPGATPERGAPTATGPEPRNAEPAPDSSPRAAPIEARPNLAAVEEVAVTPTGVAPVEAASAGPGKPREAFGSGALATPARRGSDDFSRPARAAGGTEAAEADNAAAAAAADGGAALAQDVGWSENWSLENAAESDDGGDDGGGDGGGDDGDGGAPQLLSYIYRIDRSNTNDYSGLAKLPVAEHRLLARAPAAGSTVTTLTVLLDRTVIEVFIDGLAMTEMYFTDAPLSHVCVRALGEGVTLLANSSVALIDSLWTKRSAAAGNFRHAVFFAAALGVAVAALL